MRKKTFSKIVAAVLTAAVTATSVNAGEFSRLFCIGAEQSGVVLGAEQSGVGAGLYLIMP